MKNKKPIFPRGILVAILIAFISIVGIVTLTVLESQKDPSDLLGLWEDTVLGILCSVVASVVFAILTRIYSRNDSDVVEQRLQIIETHLDRQNELYDSGIKSIRPKSHFDQEEDYWNGILSGSAIQLDLVGHSLSNWFGRRYRDTFIRKVRQIVSSGGTVNVVLSTPEPNSIGTMLSNVKTAYWHEQIKLSKVEKTLLEFYRLLKENIPEKDRCNLRIYVTDIEKVTYFYIRTDTQCIISPYTYSPGTKENIFLLELLPNTAHVKTLEDDFDAMIGNMTPLSFNLHNEEQRETGLWMEHRYSSKNNYKSRDWNREITNKFVFRDIHGIYEVGLFWHYLNKTFVKAVIELPVGFGCPSKCRYCASARIDGFYPLTAQQMQSMFEQLYRKNNLDKMAPVLLSMTGMGDIYFNQKNVFAFLGTLREYKNLSLTLSSNFWTASLLAKAVAVSNFLPIRYIQYTYVSDKRDIRENLIGILDSMEKQNFLDEYISFIQADNNSFYRINYIAISGINDSVDDVSRFIHLVNGIKDKLTIRISRLNETGATRDNHLVPSDCVRLGEINEQMKNAGLQSYIFYSEHNDNMNCGQLITEFIQY